MIQEVQTKIVRGRKVPQVRFKKGCFYAKLASAGFSVLKALTGREGGPFNARYVKESTAWNSKGWKREARH